MRAKDNLVIIAREDQSIFSSEWLDQIAELINHARKYHISTKPLARMLRSPDGYVFGVPLYYDAFAPKDRVYAITALVPDPPVVVT